MSARSRILAAVRKGATQGGTADDPARARVVDARIGSRTQTAPIPKIARLEGTPRVDAFVERAEVVDATVTRLSRLEDLPGALSDQLRARNLPQSVRVGAEPAFHSLDWGGVELSAGVGRVDEPASLSRAVLGIAETGTLMLHSGPGNPVTLTFLGETHFAVVKASEIEAGFEGAWTRLRDSGADPRTVNLVTGPSRTADIEQQLELGAHGPVALHIFLIEDF